MPQGTSVERVYQALLRQGKDQGTAARIAQAQTGLSLQTGKKPKKASLFSTQSARLKKFDENKIERDEDGKFAPKGGGSTGGTKKPKPKNEGWSSTRQRFLHGSFPGGIFQPKPRSKMTPEEVEELNTFNRRLGLAAVGGVGALLLRRPIAALAGAGAARAARAVRQWRLAREATRAANKPGILRSVTVIPPNKPTGSSVVKPRSRQATDLFRTMRGTYR